MLTPDLTDWQTAALNWRHRRSRCCVNAIWANPSTFPDIAAHSKYHNDGDSVFQLSRSYSLQAASHEIRSAECSLKTGPPKIPALLRVWCGVVCSQREPQRRQYLSIRWQQTYMATTVGGRKFVDLVSKCVAKYVDIMRFSAMLTKSSGRTIYEPLSEYICINTMRFFNHYLCYMATTLWKSDG